MFGQCWDDECTNLGMPGCPDLTCCEAACLKDPRCNAMNIGGLKGQAISSCILRGCPAGEPNTRDSTIYRWYLYRNSLATAENSRLVVPEACIQYTDCVVVQNSRPAEAELFSAWLCGLLQQSNSRWARAGGASVVQGPGQPRRREPSYSRVAILPALAWIARLKCAM